MRWFSDNQNVVQITKTGSKKQYLQFEALGPLLNVTKVPNEDRTAMDHQDPEPAG